LNTLNDSIFGGVLGRCGPDWRPGKGPAENLAIFMRSTRSSFTGTVQGMLFSAHSKSVTAFLALRGVGAAKTDFIHEKIRQAGLSRIARPSADDEPCKTAHCLLLRRDKVKNNVPETYGFRRPHDDGSADPAVDASNNETSLLGSSINGERCFVGSNADTGN